MSKRRTYSPEYKREAASLILDQSYSYSQACEFIDIGETALRRWVNKLRDERGGVTPTAKSSCGYKSSRSA
jgi:transposase